MLSAALLGPDSRFGGRTAQQRRPYPNAGRIQAMQNDPVQKRKSSYVRLFQIRYLPELLIRLGGPKALAKGFRDCLRPGAFTPQDVERYRLAWAQAGALTAMINYYRAVLQKPLGTVAEHWIACPTLLIWGRQDAYALPELAEETIRLCADGRIEYLDQASHWVQHDEPELVTKLVADFMAP